MKINQRQQNQPTATPRLLDLDHAKAAVLASLRSQGSRRCYEHAMVEFIDWYCSEPRLGFHKAVVTRYRMYLESRRLAAGTVNLRLAAIRRLAYEAVDVELLSPEQAAGIRRVKRAKKLGVRVGNWLLAKEARALWELPDATTLKGKRDRAILSLLLACGLRRGEVAALQLDDIQRLEDHWAIVDLAGKGGHVRTVPVPDWVTRTIREWLKAAGISSGKLFRCVCRAGKTWGDFMTDRVLWHVVKDYAAKLGLPRHHMISAALVRAYAMSLAVNWSRSNFYLGMFRCRRLRNISAASSESETRSTIASASSRHESGNCGRGTKSRPRVPAARSSRVALVQKRHHWKE